MAGSKVTKFKQREPVGGRAETVTAWQASRPRAPRREEATR